jgi:hypothetical protein
MHDVIMDLAKGGGGGSPVVETILSGTFCSAFIPTAAIIAIAFALVLWWRVSQISVGGGSGNREYLLEGGGGDEEVRTIRDDGRVCWVSGGVTHTTHPHVWRGGASSTEY